MSISFHLSSVWHEIVQIFEEQTADFFSPLNAAGCNIHTDFVFSVFEPIF